MITFKPFGKNILVKPAQEETILRSAQGVLCEHGKVIAIGDDVKYIKVGDVIGFSKWGMKDVEYEKEKYYVIPEDDRFILGEFRVS